MRYLKTWNPAPEPKEWLASEQSDVWQVKEINEPALAEFIRTTGLKEPLARILYLRDVRNPEAMSKFINPKLIDLYSPSLLPDIEKALDRISYAIANRERILLWGHEDLDGITSVVSLYETLQDLRADVRYYIPAKHVEKHGLNPEKVRGFSDNRIKLVITVDCGITNFVEVEELTQSGIDTLIIEHHEVMEKMPKAIANVDAKRKDSVYPYRNLAAVGVVLKVAMALTERILKIKGEEFFTIKPDFLAFAAIGTISDRVPLNDENRILVKYGLEQVKKTSRPVIKALFEEEHLALSGLTAERFQSVLLPLFASANGNQGCQFFLSQDYEAVKQWIRELSNQSMFWKDEARQALTIAENHLQLSEGIIIVKSAELPLRCLGHCASKLRERFQVPAIIIGKRGDTWVGECRGMDQVNLVDLLKANGKFFIDYGGHKKACGFSILEENLEPFINGAKDYARKNFAGKIKPEKILADAILPISWLTKEFADLGPFGEGNQSPLVIAPDTPLKRIENKLSSHHNPTLVLRENSDQPILVDGVYNLLYTFDENLTVYIKQTHSS
jgi:single-stranded-DNA-specific exonuclease